VQRSVKPEILDTLAPGHPDALHNRRDLRIINRTMGNWRWFQNALPRYLRPGERVLEIGAGTGELGSTLHQKIPALDGLDLWPRPADWPSSCRWHQTDLHAFDGWRDYDAVIGNMILHQFPDEDLRLLGARMEPHVRLLMFCEPTRLRRSQWVFRLLSPLFGANYVSRHDGDVSIEAGFFGDDLPRALGLNSEQWRCTFARSWLGAYRMIAERRA
jgi:2-polyprenyl-3-methyl-5-hydroxy-6-metoxy-1,4-benzoquinol methylase